jgi:protocatechuate 4,5-dioxygenase alpha chain
MQRKRARRGSAETDALARTPPQETPMSQAHIDIPGTVIFDGVQAMKGYALNKMCFSFNDKANRQAFVADEDAYCARYGLNAQQREAIRARNVLQLIEAGGNAYYLAKFAGIFGLDMQDIGAQQTGLTKDEFKARLLAANDVR